MCQLKKHAYAGLPPSENHASLGKKVRTNTRNSAFPRALVATSNFADALDRSKAGICDGVPSTEV